MRHSISTIALPPYEHDRELGKLVEFGFQGVEVAPSRIFRDTWHGLKAEEVSRYRRSIENAGLTVVGLHSLLFDRPELALFGDDETRLALTNFFVHLSSLCRDLGGRTLIWGGGRRRGPVSQRSAFDQTVAFFSKLCPQIEGHGTTFCLEPLGPADSDFVNSAMESLALVSAVAHPALKVQLDAKALVENSEATIATFIAVRHQMVHFHANEPGLGELGTSKKVDHKEMGQMLRSIDYQGFVTVEQRMVDGSRPFEAIGRSANVMKACYA